jgi:hypothetical protein
MLISSHIIAGVTNWQMIYEISASDSRPREKLAVVHTVGQSNVYFHTLGSNGPVQLTGSEAAIPFAGSDFWLADLGLEFLHWPQQRLLKREMRKTRACQVLESRPDSISPSGYARVVSWIDAEADGVLIAEAYDARGKLLKEFEVDKFTKVEGRWQLERMEIRTIPRPSMTAIEFKFDKK